MEAVIHAPEPTAARDVGALLDRLAGRRQAWARVGLPERVAYLDRCIAGMLEVADEWVRLSCRAKGIDPHSNLAGEEWLSGPMTTCRFLRLLRETLERDARRPAPGMRRGPGDRAVAAVMPASPFDRLLFRGMTAEVWIEPGRPPTQGSCHRDPPPARVGLVLGAGNISSIAPTDVAHKMFVENQVVVLKPNPVNAYLGPLISRAFRCLVEDGFLGIVHGGGDAGRELCHDPRVEAIHLTGSERTYDAIVWGADPAEQRRRKSAGEPLLGKPVTAELGCVTPLLIVPGRWLEADLAFQAAHVAAMLSHNAGFNCTTARAIVTSRGWRQRAAFLRHVEQRLEREPLRTAYYPGTEERLARFAGRYPHARTLGRPGPPGAATGATGPRLPWTFVPDLPFAAEEPALAEESFCGLIAETSIDAGDDAEAFLAAAVPMVNERIHGTLCCNILIDPDTQAARRDALERAVRDLRYGAIAVNAWTGVNFALGVTSWGAFPGHTPERIGSGVGWVHNSFLFDHPERSVVYAPFRPHPTPVWFTDHRNLLEVGRRMTRFEARPTWGRLPAIAVAGLRG